MARKYTVIGHFDCGCGQAAQPESLEVVICASQREVDLVVDRMKQHAAGHQCWVEPAMAIILVRGEPEIVHEVKQLPEAYLLFADVESYVRHHEARKKRDAEWSRTTRAEGMKRSAKEHRALGR
jgi:hypothetical protein